MNKKIIVKLVYTILLVFALIIFFQPGCSSKNKQKNILFIMADDHAYQAISSYGSKINKTPNIDRLANEGVLFQQSFVTNSICGPSRAVMLTGKYSHQNGMLDNGTTFDGSQQTFPKLLQQNGYSTAIVGKWHLKSQPTGFDYWNILPGQGQYYNPDFIEMGIKKRIQGYVTDLTTDFALSWLDKRDKSKPFCLLIHQKAPHRNWMPAEKHLNDFKNIDFPLPETFFDDYNTRGDAAKEQTMEVAKDLTIDSDLKVSIDKDESEKFDKASWESYRNRMTEEQKAVWDKAYDTENEKFKKSNLKGEELAKWKYQRYIKDYLRCVASVDENIGRVLDYLKENNLEENTIVVYTSDQGFYLGEHGWFDKRFMYEQSFRTPLIIRVPDAQKNIVNDNNMVMNIDYAPTFLDYAGIKIPKDMQGKSLKPILNGEKPNDWRTSIYYHYFEYPAEHGVKRHYGIRNSRYKLIHFYYDIDEWELYDLENDPNEIINIYNDPKNEQLINNLKIELQKLREQYKDTDDKKFLPKSNIKINQKGIGAKVTFENKYADKYSGGNNDALFDGWTSPDTMISNVDFSIWQGFEKNDLAANIDFGKSIVIKNISIGFLQYLESWIFLPEYVEIHFLNDKKNFKSLQKINRTSSINSTQIFKENFNFSFKPIEVRYLKIFAKNIGICPSWHQGAGNPAWIFTDEVIVE